MNDRLTPEGIVRTYLRDHPACVFARSFAAHKDSMLWLTLESLDNASMKLTGFLEQAGAASQMGVIVFPTLRSSTEVARLLRTLADDASGRWKLDERKWKKHERASELLAWLRWKTSAGPMTSVMGLAPFGCMPLARRSPLVALVAWPGGRENQHHTTAPPTIGFLDARLLAPHKSPASYSKAKEDAEAASEYINASQSEGAARHDVTFCLPLRARATLGW